MLSDDTEHALLVAQSLLLQPTDSAAFQRDLARRMRWWFARLPPGIGKATARACIKLWLGFSPQRSGVFSAGNGPAMRAAIIGGFFCQRCESVEEFARRSAELTHTDPKAATGAIAVARLAAWAASHDAREPPPESIFNVLVEAGPNDAEWQGIIASLRRAYCGGAAVGEFADELGLSHGVSGYMYHTVPVAAYAWLRHYGDFRATVEAALDCGGDSDTVGAIAGALAGASTGASNIPKDWLEGIVDYPCSVALLRKVAASLAEPGTVDRPHGAVTLFWPAILPRNLLLLVIVLFHGFRRLLPPY